MQLCKVKVAMMRKFCWLIIFLLLPLCSRGGERLLVQAGSVIFDGIGETRKIMTQTVQPFETDALDCRTVFFANHPLARYYTVYKITLPDGRSGWFSPAISYTVLPDGQAKLENTAKNPPWRWGFFALTLAALAGVCIRFCRLQRLGRLTANDKQWSAATVIVLTHWALLMILILGSVNLITSASDDPGYFRTMKGLLEWNFSEKWTLTIGHGFWYLPFMLFGGAREFYDIAIPFAWFAGFIVLPAAMVLAYMIVRKLTGSTRLAFCAIMFWVVVPFFYQHTEAPDAHIFQSFFAFPIFIQCFRFYTGLIKYGYNAMSDVPSTFLIMSCLFSALYLKPGFRGIAVVMAVFGFACLCRINNIFFAPVLAWIFWDRHRELFQDWKKLLIGVTVASVTLFAVFSPQFIINYIQDGDPLRFPYIRHGADVYSGFHPKFVLYSLQYLVHNNFVVMVMAVSGLFFISDRRLRITLSLWALPVIIFFFGYSHTGCDATRFILSTYPAMFAAIVAADVWRQGSKREAAYLAGALLLSFLFVAPTAWELLFVQPWDLQNIGGDPLAMMLNGKLTEADLQNHPGVRIARYAAFSASILSVALLYLLRRNRRLLYFGLMTLAVFYLGSAFVPAVLMVILLFRAIIDAVADVIAFYRTD